MDLDLVLSAAGEIQMDESLLLVMHNALFIVGGAVRAARGAKEHGFQQIGLSLRVLSVENVHMRIKIQLQLADVAKVFQTNMISLHDAHPLFSFI